MASFVTNVVLPLLILTAAYAVLIQASVLLLRRLGISLKRAIGGGFLVFGAATGILTVWVWPIELSIYINIFATLLGDELHRLWPQHLGNPWPLQVPQVYVSVSVVLCGLMGLAVQWVWNKQTDGRGRP